MQAPSPGLVLALLAPFQAPDHGQGSAAAPEAVRVTHDDTVIDRPCTLAFGPGVLPDAADDGVVRIVGDGITVRFAEGSRLVGDAEHRTKGDLRGVGIVVTGKRVHLVGARVHGYRIGIRATGADGLVLEDCDVSWNFRQHLGSTPDAEDSADWLWPHENDQGEWAQRYGAGVLVERSKNVTVSGCRARVTQNGLILDRVDDSRIFDDDFSFLSGWGIAMWRSSRDVIARCALDFCVRGYSHGVYNRGQDSAGILMFEQCCDDVIAECSVTHGGDGFFGFSGKEALGEHPAPGLDFDYTGRGNARNLLIGNDFSYAAAHGIEMTFGFDNRLIANRLDEDAICGVWGGYSKDMLIAGNTIERCGEGAYGLERGGVNIEHGERNRIVANDFRANACGVHLWWDPDEALTKLPWAVANGAGCGANRIVGNTFEGDTLAVQIRDCPGNVMAGNELTRVGRELDATPGSEPVTDGDADATYALPELDLPGRTHPVGARAALAGREEIVVGEQGPWDHETPLLQRVADEGASQTWRLLGPQPIGATRTEGDVSARVVPKSDPPRVEVRAAHDGTIAPYALEVEAGDARLRGAGVLVAAAWDVTFFPWTVDPREDADSWRAEASKGSSLRLPSLALPFGNGGPSQLPVAPPALRAAALPADRFGTLASTRLRFPAGDWRIVTRSDDGVRVWADDRLVIDDWTWHAPKEDSGTLTVDAPREILLRVEHFELDGYSTLSVEIAPARD